MAPALPSTIPAASWRCAVAPRRRVQAADAVARVAAVAAGVCGLLAPLLLVAHATCVEDVAQRAELGLALVCTLVGALASGVSATWAMGWRLSLAMEQQQAQALEREMLGLAE